MKSQPPNLRWWGLIPQGKFIVRKKFYSNFGPICFSGGKLKNKFTFVMQDSETKVYEKGSKLPVKVWKLDFASSSGNQFFCCKLTRSRFKQQTIKAICQLLRRARFKSKPVDPEKLLLFSVKMMLSYLYLSSQAQLCTHTPRPIAANY